MIIYGDCPFVTNHQVKIKEHKCEPLGNTTLCHVSKTSFGSDYLKGDYLDLRNNINSGGVIIGLIWFSFITLILCIIYDVKCSCCYDNEGEGCCGSLIRYTSTDSSSSDSDSSDTKSHHRRSYSSNSYRRNNDSSTSDD